MLFLAEVADLIVTPPRLNHGRLAGAMRLGEIWALSDA